MHRRLLALLLLLSHLAYGVAVLAHGHWGEGEAHSAGSIHHQGANGQDEATGCDHCCHASSHLTALLETPRHRHPEGCAQGAGTPAPRLRTLSLPPPTRPPKA
jgi:hypothetical protein